jgi:hypothetical protein
LLMDFCNFNYTCNWPSRCCCNSRCCCCQCSPASSCCSGCCGAKLNCDNNLLKERKWLGKNHNKLFNPDAGQ